MRNGFVKLVLGAAATLCLAAPGYSSAILSFTGTPNNLGSVTVNPTTGQVTTLTGVPYTELDYNGFTYSLDLATLTLSGNTLTLSGEVFNAANTMALPGLGTPMTLVTIQLLGPLKNIGTSTQLNVSNPGASFVSVNTQLLSDLALATSETGSLLGVGVIGTGSNFSYSVDSDTLVVQETPTGLAPEPVSFVICGGGVAALLFLKRRKRAENTAQDQ